MCNERGIYKKKNYRAQNSERHLRIPYEYRSGTQQKLCTEHFFGQSIALDVRISYNLRKELLKIKELHNEAEGLEPCDLDLLISLAKRLRKDNT